MTDNQKKISEITKRTCDEYFLKDAVKILTAPTLGELANDYTVEKVTDSKVILKKKI